NLLLGSKARAEGGFDHEAGLALEAGDDPLDGGTDAAGRYQRDLLGLGVSAVTNSESQDGGSERNQMLHGSTFYLGGRSESFPQPNEPKRVSVIWIWLKTAPVYHRP